MHKKSKAPDVVTTETLIDIGTHKLHVTLTDVPGEHMIVLEAGGGKASDSYQKIQVELAAQSGIRVMSYDRSGFGQSELGPAQFNAVDEMKALKTCLDRQGFKGNFILVGLSYGGFLIQLFTQMYPDLVRGMVLIDPMNVNFVDRFGLENLNAVTPYFSNPTENHEKAGNRIVDSASESFGALRGKELPSGTPVILITSGNAPFIPEMWRQCHEDMVRHSEQHQLLIAEGNNHDIVEENPGLVLDTIIAMVDQLGIAAGG